MQLENDPSWRSQAQATLFALGRITSFRWARDGTVVVPTSRWINHHRRGSLTSLTTEADLEPIPFRRSAFDDPPDGRRSLPCGESEAMKPGPLLDLINPKLSVRRGEKVPRLVKSDAEFLKPRRMDCDLRLQLRDQMLVGFDADRVVLVIHVARWPLLARTRTGLSFFER